MKATRGKHWLDPKRFHGKGGDALRVHRRTVATVSSGEEVELLASVVTVSTALLKLRYFTVLNRGECEMEWG